MNILYPKARESFLKGEISWNNDDIRCVLLDATEYEYADADQFLSDIPPAAIVSVSASLTSKTTAAGVADAADTFFASVTGPACALMGIYQHTGDDATARLIALLDTANGLPVVPGGGDETVAFDNGPNKIFKL